MAATLSPATLPPPAFVAPVTTLHTSQADVLATIAALSSVPVIEYDARAYLLDGNHPANVVTELTPYLVRTTSGQVTGQVAFDSTLDIPESCAFDLQGIVLQWGSALVSLSYLVRSPYYAGGVWQEFPIGVYVCTSPQADLQDTTVAQVTGSGKNYLLGSAVSQSFSFQTGFSFTSAVRDVLRAAGVLGSTATLASLVNYNADWGVKTVTTTQGILNYAPSDNWTYLGIVNDLLKMSGQQPLYTDPLGQWTIDANYSPSTQSSLIDLIGAAYTGAPANWQYDSQVSDDTRTYTADVTGVVNQWIFIQSGLTFQPTGTDGSNGRYVVNNTTTPPSDQNTVGRVITEVDYLDATGQADLVSQGNSIVQTALAGAEVFDIDTMPNPGFWYYPVFRYFDGRLPRTSIRKLQDQRWTLPLDGEMMTHEAWTVGAA